MWCVCVKSSVLWSSTIGERCPPYSAPPRDMTFRTRRRDNADTVVSREHPCACLLLIVPRNVSTSMRAGMQVAVRVLIRRTGRGVRPPRAEGNVAAPEPKAGGELSSRARVPGRAAGIHPRGPNIAAGVATRAGPAGVELLDIFRKRVKYSNYPCYSPFFHSHGRSLLLSSAAWPMAP